MDKPLVKISYKTASGKRICIEVSAQVKELLEQSDRQIRSQRRQDRRHHNYAEFIDGLTDTAISFPQEDVTDLLIKQESYDKLHIAVDMLSDVQRRRLILYFFDNLTYRKIAELEGVNQGTVGRSIKLAIKQLRKYLTE